MDYSRFDNVTENTELKCTQSHTEINTTFAIEKKMNSAFNKLKSTIGNVMDSKKSCAPILKADKACNETSGDCN